MSVSPLSPVAMPGRSFMLLMVWGVVLWFAFLVPIRLGEGIGLLEGGMKAVTFAAVVPLLMGSVVAIRALAGWGRAGLTGMFALLLAPATICDGLVFGFVPWLYGADAGHQMAAAGLILWGVGVTLFTAWWIERGA